MTSTIDMLLPQILQINMQDFSQQQQLVSRIFGLWTSVDTQLRSSILLSLRECFFRAMTASQKELYLTALAGELSKNSNTVGDHLELLGQLIKYAPLDVQPLVEQVLLLAQELHKPKDRICMMHFLKYAWDICDDAHCRQIRILLQQLQSDPDADLAEVASDVLYAIDSRPICHSGSKVALVIPEFLTSATFLQQPLDFMTALSVLEQRGITADILDNRVHNDSLSHLARQLQPYQTIIITSSPVDMVQKYYVDLRYCIFCETVNWLYAQFPDKQIIVCGAHGTVDQALLLRDIRCHRVLPGESTRAIVSYLLGEDTDAALLLRHSPRWDAVDMKWYYGRKVVNGTTYRQKNYSIVQLSQGCPYRCLFCFNIYGRQVRRMPVDTAVAQLQRLKEIGVEHIFFIDQTFTLDGNYVRELCRQMCRQKLDLRWQCETRADLITPEVVQAMKEAGCSAIWLGFESFSQAVLDANQKQLTVAQQLEAIGIIQDAGIACSGFVMLGMVADTPETIQETMDTIALHKIPTSRTANLCTVRIGTELYDRAKAAGLIQAESFCHLEAYRGSLFNDLTESQLLDALHRFSAQLR